MGDSEARIINAITSVSECFIASNLLIIFWHFHLQEGFCWMIGYSGCIVVILTFRFDMNKWFKYIVVSTIMAVFLCGLYQRRI